MCRIHPKLDEVRNFQESALWPHNSLFSSSCNNSVKYFSAHLQVILSHLLRMPSSNLNDSSDCVISLALTQSELTSNETKKSGEKSILQNRAVTFTITHLFSAFNLHVSFSFSSMNKRMNLNWTPLRRSVVGRIPHHIKGFHRPSHHKITFKLHSRRTITAIWNVWMQVVEIKRTTNNKQEFWRHHPFRINYAEPFSSNSKCSVKDQNR